MGELINTVMMLDMQPKGQESCTCGDDNGSEAVREAVRYCPARLQGHFGAVVLSIMWGLHGSEVVIS